MIIIPIFIMQLIHVRVYGVYNCLLLTTTQTNIILLGESEYWFAMIKVVMIIVFIFVGLIYDWGGVRGHPGPVRSLPFYPLVSVSFSRLLRSFQLASYRVSQTSTMTRRLLAASETSRKPSFTRSIRTAASSSSRSQPGRVRARTSPSLVQSGRRSSA